MVTRRLTHVTGGAGFGGWERASACRPNWIWSQCSEFSSSSSLSASTLICLCAAKSYLGMSQNRRCPKLFNVGLILIFLGTPLYCYTSPSVHYCCVLDSRIKAAKVRTLFAFTTFIMTRLAESPLLDSELKRKTCSGPFCVLLVSRCCSQQLEFERPGGHDNGFCPWDYMVVPAAFGDLSVACSSMLAAALPSLQNLSKDTLLCTHDWPLRGNETLFNVSFNVWRWGLHGEIRRICQGCHGSTYMLAWARRYILKRALQWREMKKWNWYPGMCETCRCELLHW